MVALGLRRAGASGWPLTGSAAGRAFLAVVLALVPARCAAEGHTAAVCQSVVSGLADKDDASLALLCRSQLPSQICRDMLASLGPKPWSSQTIYSACQEWTSMENIRSLQGEDGNDALQLKFKSFDGTAAAKEQNLLDAQADQNDLEASLVEKQASKMQEVAQFNEALCTKSGMQWLPDTSGQNSQGGNCRVPTLAPTIAPASQPDSPSLEAAGVPASDSPVAGTRVLPSPNDIMVADAERDSDTQNLLSPASNPTETFVSMSFTVANLQYGDLAANEEAMAELTSTVKENVASAAGISPDDVDLELASGSVAVTATISTHNSSDGAYQLEEMSKSIQKEAREITDSIRKALEEKPSVLEVATGELTISEPVIKVSAGSEQSSKISSSGDLSGKNVSVGANGDSSLTANASDVKSLPGETANSIASGNSDENISDDIAGPVNSTKANATTPHNGSRNDSEDVSADSEQPSSNSSTDAFSDKNTAASVNNFSSETTSLNATAVDVNSPTVNNTANTTEPDIPAGNIVDQGPTNGTKDIAASAAKFGNQSSDVARTTSSASDDAEGNETVSGNSSKETELDNVDVSINQLAAKTENATHASGNALPGGAILNGSGHSIEDTAGNATDSASDYINSNATSTATAASKPESDISLDSGWHDGERNDSSTNDSADELAFAFGSELAKASQGSAENLTEDAPSGSVSNLPGSGDVIALSNRSTDKPTNETRGGDTESSTSDDSDMDMASSSESDETQGMSDDPVAVSETRLFAQASLLRSWPISSIRAQQTFVAALAVVAASFTIARLRRTVANADCRVAYLVLSQDDVNDEDDSVTSDLEQPDAPLLGPLE